MLPYHFPRYLLDILDDGLYSSIHLRHVGCGILVSDLERFTHSFHQVVVEVGAIINNVLAISVEYRLAPEHTIPACYDDAWAVMKWVAQGTDPWLKTHADFSRVFLAGDSAGANIAHNMMMRASVDEDKHTIGLRLVGMTLIHPFFGNDEPNKIWTYICPENPRSDDPRFNPTVHPSLLSRLVCPKVLICTAGSDFYKDRGWTYYEALKGSGWGGEVEIRETEVEDHVFDLVDTNFENARCLMKWLADFFHQTG
ncbi:2-hydroxyisoflavanone dehydratase-like [Nicotiana tabacum]|uniref:2-hydroxyisoflavanone dehydratase-like n=1 Tax=Nicotiana tabacum TaxID=4097 RepID=A0A1S4B020_TOBAC